MAVNWSGTYSITTGASGTSSGSNSGTTLNNLAAVWPTGAQGLTNFTVRITGGTGVGQTRVISSNTSTQLTVPAWSVIPDNTSTYEVIALIKNGDHFTAATTFSTNVITELEDSATIYVDGNYIILLDTSSVVRWNKSESTLVTFEANNRTVQGKAGFWNYIGVPNTKTTSAPLISYIRTRDCTHALFLQPSGALGDATTCHHIWSECTNSSMAYMTGAAAVTNMRLSNFFNKGGSPGCSLNFSGTANTFTQIFEKCWSESGIGGGPQWISPSNGLSWIRDCVFNYTPVNHAVDVAAGKEQRVNNCYARGNGGPGMVFLSSGSASAAGTYRGFHNVFVQGRAWSSNNATSTATFISRSNDLAAKNSCTLGAIDIQASTNYASATSDNDYIAGNLGASYENVDTTQAATSTASPVQYKNLTASRTNARATPNFPYAIDNVATGAPTDKSVVVTFDCANGANASQSTAVSGDSASGQTTLNVTASTAFQPGMMVEIGYGTARAEVIRVASTGAGTIVSETNLLFTHAAVQADTVKPQLRHWGLPFIRYGTVSGVYSMETDLPLQDDWGLFFTGLKTTYNGVAHSWQKTGHSITMQNLYANTTYYAKAYAYDPLGFLMTGTEFSFTTALDSDSFTDPGVANVRSGTTYQYNSATPNRTGTLVVPVASTVQVGVVYDGATTGTYNGSDRWTDPGDSNVRYGVAYKANSTTNNKTGRVTVPVAAQVEIGVPFETDLGGTGTYDGSDRWTALSPANVLSGVNYKSNSTTPNQTGTLVPGATASQIATAVWSEDLTGYNTANTAGLIVKTMLKLIRNLLALVLG